MNFSGREYFPRYEFDALYQPLPIIKDVLKALGNVADSWTVAAWFHCPNAGPRGQSPVAPKDALDRGDDLLSAATQRRRRYVA